MLRNALALAARLRYVTGMVLSNAERQARYRRNLKARAQGVTAADVMAATEVMYRYVAIGQPDMGDWAAFVDRCRKRGNWRNYGDLWDSAPDDSVIDEMNGAGLDGELVRRVWPVAYSVLRPPVPE